jgi:hypothetical protein
MPPLHRFTLRAGGGLCQGSKKGRPAHFSSGPILLSRGLGNIGRKDSSSLSKGIYFRLYIALWNRIQ